MGLFDFFKRKYIFSNIIKKFNLNANIGIITPQCPYCNKELQKFPLKKTQCKHCKNYIYVRTRPSDNKKILIKDNEINIIEQDWQKKSNLKTLQNISSLQPSIIYSYKKPKFIDFISNKDYEQILKYYSYHFYPDIDLNFILNTYPYPQYNWNILLAATYVYQNYCKKIAEYKKNNIKKVELVCINDCECCKKLKEGVNIDEIVELPRTECELEIRHCIGATYTPIISFDN